MLAAKRFADRQVGSNNEPLRIQFITGLDAYGAPLDLTTAAVTFRMADAITGELIVADKPGTGASNGVASYQPTLAELDTPGEYACQFAAAYPDGTVQRSEVVWLRLLANPASAPELTP